MKSKIFSFLLCFFLIFSIAFSNENSNSVEDLLYNLEEEKESILYNDKLVKNQPKDRFVNSVKLQGLNKITGKTFEIETGIDEIIKFERLDIIPLKCWKSYPEEAPENKLLLKIYENNVKDNSRKLIFFGWIFSSSPSISGLEHPFYDIKLEDCYNIIEDEN